MTSRRRTRPSWTKRLAKAQDQVRATNLENYNRFEGARSHSFDLLDRREVWVLTDRRQQACLNGSVVVEALRLPTDSERLYLQKEADNRADVMFWSSVEFFFPLLGF